MREAVYGSPVWGRTITELREIKAPAYIRWSTLMQEGTLFTFVPKQDDMCKIQIALKELKKNSGTGVTIRFDYSEVGFNGPLCCISFLAEDLLKSSMEANLPDQWTKSMMRRKRSSARQPARRSARVHASRNLAAPPRQRARARRPP